MAGTSISIVDAIVLGLVEGITEYLPVSSTGHLILASSLLGLNTPERESAVNAFTIVVQGGAILAVLGLYWDNVWKMAKGAIGRDNSGFRLLVNLVVAFIPAAVLGKLLDDHIERVLFHPVPVLLALGVGGVFMIVLHLRLAGRWGPPVPSLARKELADLTLTEALIIGLLQCVAMWPGTSRSMMTISGGLLVGLKPKAAAEFSFLLGLPTLTAATLYVLGKDLYTANSTGAPSMFDTLGWLPIAVGIGVATVSAALAVRWLVGFLARRGLAAFGWYRLALCAVLAGLWAAGIVTIGAHGREVNETQREVPPIEWSPASGTPAGSPRP
ncbi:MAG: undecaprenyl-diphosphate phosphatase [Planctomycetota bacterium]|nr:undecaprenyl-diphosphate phosphatase [Planctomycetota bacterium]